MIVSILQLMGFPMGKPVNSRASEVAQGKPSNAANEGISSKASDPAAKIKCTSASETHAQANSARRQEVKAQPGKAKMASKPAKANVKAKPAVKAVVKPVTKAQAKPTVKVKAKAKAGAKSVAKPVLKAAKSVAKSAAGSAVKAPLKKTPPPTKTPVKAAVGGKEIKSAPKAVVKGVRATPVKAVKPTAKVTAKDSVKTMIAKAGKSEVVAPKSKAGSHSPPVPIAMAAVPAKPVVAAPTPVLAASVPARAGRPSSRLAQLTVPSMAQSVASTAAKASFSQTMSSPLIVPPLASAVKKDPKLANNWKLKPVEELTDADLIAMPDDEYMNDTQMAYFRRKLSKLKLEILNNAGETTEHLREDTVVVPDPADRATIEEEHALELRTRDRERKLLKKIEQSIVRIDSGDYGYCDETGESIGVGRLLARPTANLSLEAQQRRELKQKMFGD